MSYAHEEKGVEVVGVVPSIAMVLAGLVVAIFPGTGAIVFAGGQLKTLKQNNRKP